MGITISNFAIGFCTKMKQLYWTKHAEMKMRYYRLSPSRVKRVIHSPERVEEGIAEDTIAAMQPFGNKKNKEIWVMVADEKTNRFGKLTTRRKVISAWIYPARTKPGEPLPEEILKEFREVI